MTAAAVACFVAAAPALAQNGGGGADEPFSGPVLVDDFPGDKGAQKTPTPKPTREPTPSPTPEETETPTPTPEASPTPTATAKPGRTNAKDLPNTGSDPLRVGLMGLTLLGFGFSLRLSLTEARSRN